MNDSGEDDDFAEFSVNKNEEKSKNDENSSLEKNTDENQEQL